MNSEQSRAGIPPGRGGEAATPLAPSRPPDRRDARPALPAAARVSTAMPLAFILTGVLSLFIGVALLIARPDLLATYHYNPHVIAVTHLLVLGWILSIVIGAANQLAPVALQTTLHNERLPRWHYACHLLGFTGMAGMFWVWNLKAMALFGSLLTLGMILFVYNLARTLARIPKWNVVAFAMASALGWLLLTVFAGLLIACAKLWYVSPFSPLPQMHAHAHLGLLGGFIILIVGISYKLVPMFTLSELQSHRRAVWSVALLNAGAAGIVVSILCQSPWKLFCAVIAIAGLVLYGIELQQILRARKRRQLDWAVRYFLTAISLLVPLAALAVVLSWPGLEMSEFIGRLENLYGAVAVLGLVTLAILGMLYKIVPFLVWYSAYSREIGRRNVPALADLYSPALQSVTYWLYLAGLLALSIAIVLAHEAGVRWSCALLAGALVPFAINLGKILGHLVRPRTTPLLRQLKAQPI